MKWIPIGVHNCLGVHTSTIIKDQTHGNKLLIKRYELNKCNHYLKQHNQQRTLIHQHRCNWFGLSKFHNCLIRINYVIIKRITSSIQGQLAAS